MFPDGDNAGFCEIVHGAAKRIAELEGTVRRMILEVLGVAEYHEAQNESAWHLIRMSEYKAPNAEVREVRYGSHQDTNSLSVVCQHEVDGLEMQTRDGEWVLVEPSSPTSLVVMVGNALRAWSNDRLRAPFHRITVRGDVTRYSAILFSVPGDSMIGGRLMNSWTRTTLAVSGNTTTTNSFAFAYLRKELATKTNSRPTVECRQGNAMRSSVEPQLCTIEMNK